MSPSLPLALLLAAAHAFLARKSRRWRLPTVILAAYTLGAWLRTGTFALLHDLSHERHGNRLDLAFRLAALPSVNTRMFTYYDAAHVASTGGHHTHFGQMSTAAVDANLPFGDGDIFPGSPSQRLLLRAQRESHNGSAASADAQRYEGVFGPSPLFHHLPMAQLLVYDVLYFVWALLDSVRSDAALVVVELLRWHPDGQATRDAKSASDSDAEWQAAETRIAQQAVLVCITNALLLLGVQHLGMPARDRRLSWRQRMPAATRMLLYLSLSEVFFAGVAHPNAALFLAIHHSVLPIEKGTMPQDMPGNSTSPPSCQPTSSVYSPVADVLWFNLGRHTEHHDFPEVPWYRLHYLSALASEHYDSLGRFTSVAEVFDRFVREHKTWGYACQGRVPFTTLTA